jgi:hypothetical protein
LKNTFIKIYIINIFYKSKKSLWSAVVLDDFVYDYGGSRADEKERRGLGKEIAKSAMASRDRLGIRIGNRMAISWVS